MAYLSGIRIKHLTRESASTTIRHKWLVQNPFRSTYFACLGMAAEMPAGLLVLMAANGLQPRVSTLPVAMESTFVKKATGTTTFICEDGDMIFNAVDQAVLTGDSISIKTLSVGRNDSGEEVASFRITWSIMQKK